VTQGRRSLPGALALSAPRSSRAIIRRSGSPSGFAPAWPWPATPPSN